MFIFQSPPNHRSWSQVNHCQDKAQTWVLYKSDTNPTKFNLAKMLENQTICGKTRASLFRWTSSIPKTCKSVTSYVMLSPFGDVAESLGALSFLHFCGRAVIVCFRHLKRLCKDRGLGLSETLLSHLLVESHVLTLSITTSIPTKYMS